MNSVHSTKNCNSLVLEEEERRRAATDDEGTKINDLRRINFRRVR